VLVAKTALQAVVTPVFPPAITFVDRAVQAPVLLLVRLHVEPFVGVAVALVQARVRLLVQAHVILRIVME